MQASICRYSEFDLIVRPHSEDVNPSRTLGQRPSERAWRLEDWDHEFCLGAREVVLEVTGNSTPVYMPLPATRRAGAPTHIRITDSAAA